jgi:H+/Cl- antiporter ClcA
MNTGVRNRFWHLVVLVGVVSGLMGASFVAVLKLVTRALGPSHWADWPHLGILIAVGAAIGLLTKVLGNPGDVELLVDNIHISGGRAAVRELRSLIPVSLLGIAAGSAIGPEAPLVQSTGTVASWLAAKWKLEVADARVLTITGMAAGFAVLFGAPLGSAIFALEILHRRGLEYYEALLPAGIGALSGYAVYIGVNRVGFEHVWSFPAAHDLRAIDLGIGIAAGVVGAILATAFTYLSHFERHWFHRLPPTIRPIVGGAVLGGLAFISPYALTFGEAQIGHIATTKLAVGTLLLAAAVKLVASSTIVSAGWRGGFIIPLFFVGATVGAAAGHISSVDTVVAMTALMVATNVGVTKTPFGSTLVVTEMAGMALLPSTMLAAIVALFLTSRVSMIETQRERDGAFGPFTNRSAPRPLLDTPEPASSAAPDAAGPVPATSTPPAAESTE